MAQEREKEVGQGGARDAHPLRDDSVSDGTPSLSVALGTVNTSSLTLKARAVGMCALDGDVVILPGSAPLMTVLRTGCVTLSTLDGQTVTFNVGPGIAQITPLSVRVVCETISRAAAEGETPGHKTTAGEGTMGEDTRPSPQPLVWGDDLEC